MGSRHTAHNIASVRSSVVEPSDLIEKLNAIVGYMEGQCADAAPLLGALARLRQTNADVDDSFAPVSVDDVGPAPARPTPHHPGLRGWVSWRIKQVIRRAIYWYVDPIDDGRHENRARLTAQEKQLTERLVRVSNDFASRTDAIVEVLAERDAAIRSELDHLRREVARLTVAKNRIHRLAEGVSEAEHARAASTAPLSGTVRVESDG